MSPYTIILLTAALCIAVLGYQYAAFVFLAASLLNQIAFGWATQTDEEG